MRKTPQCQTILNTYDEDWSKYPPEFQPRNQLEIEMGMFARLPNDPRGVGLGKAEHFKNVLQIAYPWIWSNYHEWYDMCLWAWTTYQNIGMTGCGAAHKTFFFSLLAGMEFFCAAKSTAVIMTSTSLGALKTRLWPRFKEFYNLTLDGRKIPMPFHVVESKTMIQATQGDDEHSIRAVAVDKGKVDKALGKIIGNHPGRVVMVVDEAPQTEEAVFAAKTNLAIGTDFFRFVAIGNAISRFDNHGQFCEPKNGWNSISVEDVFWETKNGICLHFDGLKSPNVLLGEQRFPKLFSRVDIDRIRRDDGENSLRWWSQCRGFWPPSGISNTVLDEARILSGHARDRAVWKKDKITIAALDPAFTTGGDRCVLRFGDVGQFTDDVFGLELTDIIEIQLDVSGNVPINYQIADRVKQECEARKVAPENFAMDATAASGLADIISQRWSDRIRRVNFGGKATERPVSDLDQRKSCDSYANRVTELWFGVERMVAARKLRGLDTATGIEFCLREFKLVGERKVVEPKADMKERMGGKSPDLADPTALLVDIFRDMDVSRTEVAALPQGQIDHMELAKRFANIHASGYRAA